MKGEMEVYETTGQLIKEQRKKAGLTQRQLAEKSGIDVRTIERLESGESELPQYATIIRLAKTLGIHYAALLGKEYDELNKVKSIRTGRRGDISGWV